MAIAQAQISFADPHSPELTTNLRAAKTLKQITELRAAGVTDYQNFGVLLTPQFEREITDIARQRGVFGQLLDKQAGPASGHPTRWYEQYALPNGGAFTDPRSISPGVANNGGTLRNEKSANIRAIAGQIQFGLFDQQTNAQTSLFPQLVAKDLKDMLTNIMQQEDLGLFNGSATSLTDGSSLQFCSIATQATNTIQINPGQSIIDSIRTKVATMMANASVVVKPTHIFMNPLAIDLLEQEVKNAGNTVKALMGPDVEVVPGVSVTSIRTVAGTLPIVPAWEMAYKTSSVTGASNDYPIFIASMNLIEKQWIGMPGIQLYKLGLTNDLADKYVGVAFNSGAILKAAAYAHAYGYVSR